MLKRLKFSNILMLYRKSSHVTLWLVGSQLLAAGVAFFVNLLAASAMTPDSRGYLALLLQVGYLLSVVAMLGVERPFVARISAGFDESVSGLAKLTQAGYWVMLVPIAFSIWYLVMGSYELAVCFGLLVFFGVANIHVRIVRSAYISSQTWKPFVINSIAMQTLLLILAIIFVILNISGTNFWLFAYVMSSGVASLLIFSRYSTVHGKRFVKSSDFSHVRRQGIRLFPASLGNTAMLRSDRLLLPFLAGPAELGFYVVVATSMDMASWPVQQWVDAKLNQWRDAGRRTKGGAVLLILRVGLSTAVIALAVGVAVSIIIDNYLPEDYKPAKKLIMPLGIAVIVYAMTRVQQGLMIARSWSGGVSIAETLGMFFSVAAYVALIPFVGAMGAALGSLVGYSVCFVAGSLVWLMNYRKDRVK